MAHRSKINTSQMISLNNLGLSLATIAEVAGCHPSTVTTHLKEQGIPVIDTRRTFMEDVLSTLSPKQLAWVNSQLRRRFTIKDLVRQLLIEASGASSQHQTYDSPFH